MSGSRTAPFILMITAVLVLVIGIELIATVVTNTDTIVTAGSATSNFPLVGTIAVFIPVVYIAAMMTLAGGLGLAATRGGSGDKFTGLILVVLTVVIGIALGATVMTSSNTALTAINATTNSMALAATVMPFLPVVYIAGILGLAGMAGVRSFRG